jgi:hypothetical protein
MHAAMQPPEEGGAGEPPPGLRPQPGWAPLATTCVWSVVLWALILLVVTDGSSSSFVGFSLLELVCVFSKYEFLHCHFFYLLHFSTCHT